MEAFVVLTGISTGGQTTTWDQLVSAQDVAKIIVLTHRTLVKKTRMATPLATHVTMMPTTMEFQTAL